jgi:hypothetical protein
MKRKAENCLFQQTNCLLLPRAMPGCRPGKCGVAFSGNLRSIAAATLSLSLGMMPAHAATIKVGGSCKLYLAIHAANLDQPLGTCARGKGADTIAVGQCASALWHS